MAYRPYTGRLASDYANASRGGCGISWLLSIQEEFVLAMAPAQVDSALDVGCGAGSLVARLLDRGIQDVVGIDISDDQIEICLNSMPGAQFLKGDCREIGHGALQILSGRFQLVNASWIFDSASSIADLHLLTNGIARALKRPGVHTGVCLNPYIRVSLPHEWHSYGISLGDGWAAARRPVDGDIIAGRIALSSDSGSACDVGTRLEARYFSHKTYDEALRGAGFSRIDYFCAKDWLSVLDSRSSTLNSKFSEYANDNPEMIAYRAYL